MTTHGETPDLAEAPREPLSAVLSARRLGREKGERPAAAQERSERPVPAPTLFDDLVGRRFELGGRGETLDCLGVTLEAVRRRGLPVFDPWEAWRDAWEAGELADGLPVVPKGWRLAERPLQDEDVVLTSARSKAHVGFVWCGKVLTAHEALGVCQLSIEAGTRGLVAIFRSEGR